MPPYCDDDRRRRGRQQRGDAGRRVRSTSATAARSNNNGNNLNGNGNGNGNGIGRATSSLASLRSQHHILPQDYVDDLTSSGSGSGSGSSSGAVITKKATTTKTSPAVAMTTPGSAAATVTVGNNNGATTMSPTTKSPGAPPPPPPPYPRGSRGGGSANNNNNVNDSSSRGRSLSVARSNGGSKRRSSRHGEAKDGDDDNNGGGEPMMAMRGRSLPVARPPPFSTKTENNGPRTATDGTKSTRRRRSRSRSRPRRKKESSDDGSGGSSSSSTRNKKSSTKAAVAASASSSSSSSSTTTKADHLGAGRRVAASGGDVANVFERVMAAYAEEVEEDDDVPSSRRTPPIDSSGSAAATAATASRDRSRGRERRPASSRPRSRGGKDGGGARSSSSRRTHRPSSKAAGGSKKKNADRDQPSMAPISSSSSSSPTSQSLPLSSSRRFMVEISDAGEVVQVFEFSYNGAPPPPGQGDAGGFRSGHEEAIIEKIRRRYSGSGTGGSDGDERRGDDDGRGGGHSSASRSSSSARKIVVESDGRDNLVRAIELPSDGAGLRGGDDATTPRAPRDESPFSKREMGRKEEVGGPEKPPEKARERRSVSFLLDDDREEALGANDDRSDVSEESSPSRGAGNIGRLASSVAADLNVSTTSTLTLDASERSGESGSGGGGRRSVSFLDDHLGREESSTSPARAKSTLDASERSDESEGAARRSVSFLMDQPDHLTKGLSEESSPSRGAGNIGRPASSVAADLNVSTTSALTLDASERSGEFGSGGGGRRSVSFLDDHLGREESPTAATRAKSALDASERSDESGGTARLSVSFLMDRPDHLTKGSFASDRQSRGSSAGERRIAAPPRHPPRPPPAARGRSDATRPTSGGKELPGSLRRARSLSSNNGRGGPAVEDSGSSLVDDDGRGGLIIEDSSSLTAGGGAGDRRPPSYPPPPPTTRGRDIRDRSSASRKTRSLSRPRSNGGGAALAVVAIRDRIDFDPAVSTTGSQQQHERGGPPPAGGGQQRRAPPPSRGGQDRRPPLQKSLVMSHSTAETCVSALTFDTEEESLFTNLTTQAVRGEGGGEDDPLMNSTLTIFEDECEDDGDQSLLSDPMDFVEHQGAAHLAVRDMPPTMRVRSSDHSNVAVAGRGDNADLRQKQARCSRIRRMLSRKEYSKRRAGSGSSALSAKACASSQHDDKSALDTSEETRETLGSSDPSILEDAHNSLMLHQRQRSSRLSRFLNR